MAIVDTHFDRKGTLRRKTTIHVKPKHVRWSHQNELESLKGRKIAYRLTYMDDDDWRYATLVDADQFAIKLQDHFFTSAQQSTVTYFKPQIAAFAAA